MDCHFLPKDEVASKVRIMRRFLDQQIAAGTGPQVVRIDARALVRADDFAAWIEGLEAQSRHTDAAVSAEAVITPDMSMYLRLEHANGTKARRISLSSLASLLAAGLLLEEAAPTLTSTPAETVPPLLAELCGRSTGPRQIGMSEAQRAALQQQGEAPAQQTPAGTPA